MQLLDDSSSDNKNQVEIVSSTVGLLPRVDPRAYDLTEFPFSRNLSDHTSIEYGFARPSVLFV